MATYYSIDDGHGNQIVTGLQDLRRAREIAQRHANESGLATLLYSSDDEINEVIRPKPAKKSKARQHATKKSAAQLQREIDEVLAKPKSPTKRTTAPKRSHSTVKEDRLHEAQLYWDDQDPKNEGWWLRYRDAGGTEQGTAIEADEDASTEELAAAVEAESHWLPGNGKIKVFRGDQPRGSIMLTDGKVSDWRAG